MQIFCINYVLSWVQIHNGWGTYTCPMEKRCGELYFKFKNEWHKVADYTTEYTSEFK